MYEYDKSQELNNQSENQEDDAYDCDTLPTVGMDIHTFSDFKYYFMTLGFTIMTMLILKLVWKLTKSISKCVSFTVVKTIDDLSNSLKDKLSQKTERKKLEELKNDKAIPRVDSFQSNKLDAILFRNGTKVRRSQSSSTSLKSVSLSDDSTINTSGPVPIRTTTDTNIGMVRTDSEMSRIEKGVVVTNDADNSNTNIDYKKFTRSGLFLLMKK